MALASDPAMTWHGFYHAMSWQELPVVDRPSLAKLCAWVVRMGVVRVARMIRPGSKYIATPRATAFSGITSSRPVVSERRQTTSP